MAHLTLGSEAAVRRGSSDRPSIGPEEKREFAAVPLDTCRLAAYTSTMSAEPKAPVTVPCLCFALRQASRAVSRLYDEELRGVGLRTTQYSLLQGLRRYGELRQRDL